MPNTHPPIIDSFTAPATVVEGSTFQVAIVAHDADARSVMLTGKTMNPGGASTQQQVTVVVGDEITYELTTTDPDVTITQTATPGVFQVTV